MFLLKLTKLMPKYQAIAMSIYTTGSMTRFFCHYEPECFILGINYETTNYSPGKPRLRLHGVTSTSTGIGSQGQQFIFLGTRYN